MPVINMKRLKCILVIAIYSLLVACQSTSGVGQSFKESLHKQMVHSYCYKYMYGHDGAATIDYYKAYSWCAKSIITGDSSAMTLMAEMYFFGLGRDIDYTKSFYWYEQATKLKHSHAQFMLAHSYRHGFGVEKSMITAQDWEEMAFLNGHQKPISALR